jgi:hypothetical protein
MPTKAPVDHQQAVAATLTALTCGQPRCRCAVSERRGRGRTHCPVHQDVTPSFGVDIKDGRMLTFCYAGCSQNDVIAALKARELWPEGASAEQDIVATYDYKDKSGRLVYQTVRYVPKDFRQRRPKSGGGWLWNLDDTPRVVYRLPDLLMSQAKDPDHKMPYFIVEGEKDVDRLYVMGQTATCNVGGAGKWRSSYAEHFKGCVVVIIVDNDDAGMIHARQVASTLQGVAKRVLWLELGGEEHDDLSDWLDAGHTTDELLDLARHAPKPPDGLDPKRETVFTQRGLSFLYEPADAPITMHFSRLADHKDETDAEVLVARLDGTTLVRRRLNLLGASGVPKTLIDVLEGAQLGVDSDLWVPLITRGFESVLSAHRNGLVLQTTTTDYDRPDPIEWLCDGLVMRDRMNCWLGAASTGKSTLAKMLCVAHATGQPFIDKTAGVGTPLYLDWEDDFNDFRRVAWDMCHALGVQTPVMHWINMRGKRLRDSVETLSKIIEDNHVSFVVIDSIAAAGGFAGEHRGYEDIALELELCLGQLPPVTVLGLDHVTSEDHKANNRIPTKARGAERKVEFYRNQWSLVADMGERERHHHIIAWHHTKINADIYRNPFVVEIVHRDGELSVLKCDPSASPEFIDRQTDQQKVEGFVRENPGATLTDIYNGITEGVLTQARKDIIRAQVNRARKSGHIQVDKGKRYWWQEPDDDDDDPDDDEDTSNGSVLPFR